MRLFYAIFISLAVHFILVTVLDFVAPYFETKPPTVAEVELIETPKKIELPPKNKGPERQIVREALAPKSELKEDDEDLARFLSADKQRVKKEMQAALSGMTKNRVQGKKEEPKDEPKPHKTADDGEKKYAKDYDPDNIIARTLREHPQGIDDAPSSMGDSLPQDVSIGSFTALNTDRYTFYSFFARIEELVRFRWESRVRQALDTFDRGYLLSVVGRRAWVTSIDIWLTPDGRFHSAHIMRESGIGKFDQAAANAFREAGMFPNPPQEMVEDDGYIHLKYNFNVSFRPSAVVYQ
jgi:TonB family protein